MEWAYNLKWGHEWPLWNGTIGTINKVSEKLMKLSRGREFQEEEQEAHRPWGVTILGLLVVEKWDQCGVCEGKNGGNTLREVMRVRAPDQMDIVILEFS